MADTTFNLRIIVDPSGAVRGVKAVGGAVRKIETRVDKLRKLILRTFAFAGITLGIRELIRLADTFLKVQNRLRVVTDGQAELAGVTQALFGIARRTRSEFAATAELYARLAINSKELGRSSEELLQFTESLNEAIIISGASAKEANSGLIQLSQGLASGVLRGDELRSVLEQLPTVADVISEHMGITRGELRELGTQGKITADIVIESFLAAEDALKDRFGKTIPTIAQAMVLLKNASLEFVGVIETSTGVTAGFARFIIVLADNFEVLARTAAAAGIALAIQFARVGIGVAIKAVQKFTLTLLANPLTALPTLITVVVAALIAFGDQIDISGGSVGNLQDLAVVTFQVIGDAFLALRDLFTANFGAIADVAREAFNNIDFSIRGMLIAAALVADTMVGIFVGLFNGLVQLFVSLPDNIASLTIQALNGLIKTIEFVLDAIIALFRTVGNVISRIVLGVVNSLSLLATAARQALVGNASEAASLAREAAEVLANGIKGAFKDIPGEFNRNFKLAQNEVILPEIENAFAGGAKQIGEAVLTGLTSGLDITAVQDFIGELLGKAEERASRRQLDLGVAGANEDGSGAPGGGPDLSGPTKGFEKRLAALTREKELAAEVLLLSQDSIAAGELRVSLAKIEEEFRKKGLELSMAERDAIAGQLEQARLLTEQQTILEGIRGPAEEIARQTAALNQLFADGAINIEEYNNKLRDLEAQARATDKSISAGFANGLDKVQENITDLASATENALVNAFQSAEDALVSFVTEGQVDMKEFARNIIADITKVIAKLLILQAIEGLAGVPGFGFLGDLIGKAHGGPTSANETILVGEKGPELFNPSTSGNIIPNDVTSAALGTSSRQQPTSVNVSAPPATVQVINVTDPDEIPASMESSAGEQAILNVIGRNTNTIRRTLG